MFSLCGSLDVGCVVVAGRLLRARLLRLAVIDLLFQFVDRGSRRLCFGVLWRQRLNLLREPKGTRGASALGWRVA